MLNYNNKRNMKTYEDYIRFKVVFITALALIVLTVALFAIASGSAEMNIREIIKAIFGQGTERNNSIVWKMRLPRVITAVIAGIGLSTVGCVMQSILRNPLASASTLGVSQGAAFGAAFSIVILNSGTQLSANASVSVYNPVSISICAFIGSMISTMVIISMSRLKKVKPESMILSGVALSTLFSGGTALIQYFSDSVQLASIVYWTFGSLSSTSWREILIMSIVIIFALVFFEINCWGYNVLLGGENTAKGLGVNTERLIISSMILCSLTASVITSFIGIINFIGLIAPHLMRKIIGSDYRFLLPASAIAGACILLLSDTVSRLIVQPMVLPIGAITSFVGAPVFLYLIYNGGKRK